MSNDDSLDDNQAAQIIIHAIGPDTILVNQNYVWIWSDEGVWKKLNDIEFKQIVKPHLQDTKVKLSMHRLKSVSAMIKVTQYAPELNWNHKEEVLNLMNGELKLTNERSSLSKHKANSHFNYQIPVAVDSSAECPRFLQFLDEIFAGDEDAEAKKSALLEMMAYSFFAHTKFGKFILLIGNGGNGKSILLGLLRKMLGTENVCAVNPSDFSNRFQRGHLSGKLANLVTELPEGAQIADAELKAITTGDLMTAEHKNKPPFNFKPFCTCWFAANHLPRTKDFSDALQRRAIILYFNNSFTQNGKADPNLEEKLYAEIPGIFNLIMEAYRKVLRDGTFTEPQSSEAAKREWKLEADQVQQFIEEKCVAGNDLSVASISIYENYREWADKNGIRGKLSHIGFTKRLKAKGYTPDRTGKERFITGIDSLKPWDME